MQLVNIVYLQVQLAFAKGLIRPFNQNKYVKVLKCMQPRGIVAGRHPNIERAIPCTTEQCCGWVMS